MVEQLVVEERKKLIEGKTEQPICLLYELSDVSLTVKVDRQLTSEILAAHSLETASWLGPASLSVA